MSARRSRVAATALSFLAKLWAAMVISLPVLAAGFAAQDKRVHGFSLGAVK